MMTTPSQPRKPFPRSAAKNCLTLRPGSATKPCWSWRGSHSKSWAMACSTCHVLIGAADFAKLPPPTDDEEDMLDFAAGVGRT